MTERIDQSANGPQAVHRANLHYLLEMLAGRSESNDKTVQNSPISDGQTKVYETRNGNVM